MKDLTEEREMSKALQSNLAELETRFKKAEIEKNLEMTELREQIRDLMFFLEAQSTIANSDLKDELAGSSVTIPEPTVADAKSKTRRKKK